MKVLDLFSGIGGFSLGLERAGFETVAFCEIDKFCQKVLNRHWPGVPIYDDVREITRARLVSDGITGIEVVTGGFPCQDLSFCGKQAGITGERSGLWKELCRIISEIQPRYAIIENVSALLNGGNGVWFKHFLEDLAAIGYDCEWDCIQPKDIGIPSLRDRVWVCAYPKEINVEQVVGKGRLSLKLRGVGWAHLSRYNWSVDRRRMGRSADGIPSRPYRLGALGNAVVTQIPEIIGRAIMEIEECGTQSKR